MVLNPKAPANSNAEVADEDSDDYVPEQSKSNHSAENEEERDEADKD